jgi:hypothetical protein
MLTVTKHVDMHHFFLSCHICSQRISKGAPLRKSFAIHGLKIRAPTKNPTEVINKPK